MIAPFILFTFGLVFAPLAFGTVEQWSLAVLELTVGAAYIWFFLAVRSSKGRVLKVPTAASPASSGPYGFSAGSAARLTCKNHFTGIL